MIAGRHKTNQIPNNTSTQREQRIRTLSVLMYQPIQNLLKTGQRFTAFACWNHENMWFQASLLQQTLHSLSVKRSHARIRHDKDPFTHAQSLQSLRQLAKTAPFNNCLRERGCQTKIGGDTSRIRREQMPLCQSTDKHLTRHRISRSAMRPQMDMSL